MPPGETIANEHWDYPLPIAGAWIDPSTPKKDWPPNGYRSVLVPVLDEDNAGKLARSTTTSPDVRLLRPQLAARVEDDRRLPDRFPLMTRFYKKLFAGRLGFEESRRSERAARCWASQLDDLRAEEAFWVYDHRPCTSSGASAADRPAVQARPCPTGVGPA